MSWEIVVGIETHAQLMTRSKIFSGASTAFGGAPNTQASAVDIALPGVLPVLNARAVELAVRFGAAIGGAINPRSVFARKNYFYPDLPKGYQISQYELPIVQGGALRVVFADGERAIAITRAHLEEDAGKSLHELPGARAAGGQGVSGIDLNRAGTPLLEIVSEPELRGAKEAVAYARTLHALVRWIGICDGNMQEGSFRCDANVSVRRAGEGQLGTRCEIKNLNSFRFLERAVEYEARRQIAVIEEGGRVAQETRLYDAERDETRSMRSKEDAQDYRYFPDPDLLPLALGESAIERIRQSLPELPAAKRERYARDYGLGAYDAALLTGSRATAEYFERSLAGLDPAQLRAVPKQSANLVNVDLAAYLNRENLEIEDCPIPPEHVGRLARLLAEGTISSRIKKELLEEMWRSRADPEAIVEARGLRQISDAGALEALVDEALAAHPQQVEDWRAGREKAFNSLVGQVMKRTQGKANPAQVSEILRRKLAR